MVPEYVRGTFWRVETETGEYLVPSDLVPAEPTLEDFRDYVDRKPLSFEAEWDGPHETEAAAQANIREMVWVDDETGDELEDEGAA